MKKIFYLSIIFFIPHIIIAQQPLAVPVIDPLAAGECILDTPQNIDAGGKVTIVSNKKFVINGKLNIQ